jgi:MarR family transcriptional regulator, organic hydroperoxide resistance regulator
MAPKNDIGLLLLLVSKAHHRLGAQEFEKLGLLRGQPPVLFEVGKKDGITQSELAQKLEVTPATMTNLLRRMEASGLISRIRDENDFRFSNVHLTEAGRQALAQAVEVAHHIDEIIFSGFSPEEQNEITNYLERIHSNLTGS